MTDRTYNVKIAVKNTTALNSILAAIDEDKELVRVEFKNSDPADLMVIELDGAGPTIIQKIEALLDTKKTRELFLMSETPDSNLLMGLMRMGVKEFFQLPLNAVEFKAAIGRFKKRSAPGEEKPLKKDGQVISVVGSKGGVGTTTVAVNLAVSLAGSHKNMSVALFDMNTLFGEIPLFLDLAPKFHWGEITKNIERLDDMFLMNILSRHSSGVHLLPSPSYLNGNNTPSMDVIDRLLGLMRTMFDYIVVDAGQSMGDSNLRTIQHSDSVLLVSLLNMPCLSNTNRLIKSLTELGYVSKDQLKVIINRNLKKNDVTVKDAESGIGKEIYCVIPNDYRTTMAAINQGKPLQLVAPKSPIAKQFQEMTKMILPRPKEEKKSKWRFFGR